MLEVGKGSGMQRVLGRVGGRVCQEGRARDAITCRLYSSCMYSTILSIPRLQIHYILAFVCRCLFAQAISAQQQINF